MKRSVTEWGIATIVLMKIKERGLLSNNELLLALSEMMDNKLKPLNEKISKVEVDMNHGLNKINIILENEISEELAIL